MQRERQMMCAPCGGSGKIDVIGEETCGGCAGSGRDTKSNCWNQPCRRCNGRGKVTYARKEICRTCGGSGRASF